MPEAHAKISKVRSDDGCPRVDHERVVPIFFGPLIGSMFSTPKSLSCQAPPPHGAAIHTPDEFRPELTHVGISLESAMRLNGPKVQTLLKSRAELDPQSSMRHTIQWQEQSPNDWRHRFWSEWYSHFIQLYLEMLLILRERTSQASYDFQTASVV